MSSRTMTGRAQAPSVFDRPLVRAVLYASIAIALAFLYITAAPTQAFAADCGSEGIDCVIPDTVDFSILNVVANIISVAFNIIIVLAVVVALFYSVTSLLGVLRAVKSGNKDELRKQGLTLGVALVVLVLAGTGAWFRIIKDAVEQGGNQLG